MLNRIKEKLKAHFGIRRPPSVFKEGVGTHVSEKPKLYMIQKVPDIGQKVIVETMKKRFKTRIVEIEEEHKDGIVQGHLRLEGSDIKVSFWDVGDAVITNVLVKAVEN